ncbi:MAG TPA: ATP-binding protein [Longimicrobium sp.]|nr:ATP-binding protein [Longimicrobium sp.]
MTSLFSPTPAAVHGRRDELAALAELLSARRRVVLHGPAGIGKTTLALAAARRWCEAGEAERVVYLSLASGADATWAVDAMGVLLAGPEFIRLRRDLRPPALLKAAAARPVVVIWDHLDRVPSPPWEGGDAVLRAILELGVELTQTGRTRLIVAGREGDLRYVPYQPSRRVEVVGVGPLDDDGARELAAGAPPALAEESVAAAEGNPLALRLLLAAGADAPAREGPAGTPLARAFDRFRLGLDEPAAHGLAALAALRDGAAGDAFRAVCGDPAGLLDRLERAGLARGAPLPDGGRYLSFHEALPALLEPAADPGALAEAEERQRRTYLELAYAWSGGESPWHPALALRELPNLLLAFARTLESDHDDVAALADTLQELLGPPPPQAPTLIQRVLTTADALGVHPAHAAHT